MLLQMIVVHDVQCFGLDGRLSLFEPTNPIWWGVEVDSMYIFPLQYNDVKVDSQSVFCLLFSAVGTLNLPHCIYNNNENRCYRSWKAKLCTGTIVLSYPSLDFSRFNVIIHPCDMKAQRV